MYNTSSVTFVRPCRARTYRRYLLTRRRQGDVTCATWQDIRKARRRTWMAVAWRPLRRDGHLSSLNSERVVTGRSVDRGQSREISREVSLDEDVCYVFRWRACRVLAGGRANSRSTSAIRWTLVQRWLERTTRGSSLAGVLKTRWVLQSVRERLDCGGRPWDHRLAVDACLVLLPGRQIAWSACVGAATCFRPSVENDLSVVGHSSVALSWINCVLCLWCHELASVP